MKNTLFKIVYLTCILLSFFSYNKKNEVYAAEAEVKTNLFQSENLDAYKKDVLNNSFGASYNQSSGIYKKASDTLTIYVDENTDQQTMPTYTITPIILNHYAETNVQRIPLKKGTNTISSNEEGILHFQNENEPTASGGITVTVKGGVQIPRFILGEMSDAQWKQEREKYPNAPGFELVGKKSLLTGGPENIQYTNTPTELMTNTDKIVEFHDKTSGLDDSSNLHRKPRGLIQHMRETGDTSAYMYAWLYHTGYSQKSNGMKNILTANGNHWGAFHELGHTYQVNRMNFGDLTEVTVNIYSLRAQKAFGGGNRLEEDNSYEEAFKHINSNNSFDSIPNLFVKLAMFWQLELAFGDDFYPQLHKLYREEQQDLQDNDAKKQYFMTSSAKITNINLLPFFEKWGLEATAETKAELKKYADLPYNIWEYRDSTDNAIIPIGSGSSGNGQGSDDSSTVESNEDVPNDSSDENTAESNENAPSDSSDENTAESNENTPNDSSDENTAESNENAPSDSSDENTAESNENTPNDSSDENTAESNENAPSDSSDENTAESNENTPNDSSDENTVSPCDDLQNNSSGENTVSPDNDLVTDDADSQDDIASEIKKQNETIIPTVSLPSTGEKNSVLLIIIGILLSLGIGGFVIFKKFYAGSKKN